MHAQIVPDHDPMDPREWDNLGTMVCFHKRYNLGDKHNYSDPRDFLVTLLGEFGKDFNDLVQKFYDRFFVLPLYLYDHSGLSMHWSDDTYPFNCQWDVSQVGWIYVTREQLTKEGIDHSRAFEILKGEVETYNQFLTGDVWGIQIFDDEGEMVDSSYGYYGYKYAEEEAAELLKEYKD
jgi:hypothetical protein